MTSNWFEDDDRLTEELGQALAEQAPPREQVEMLMVGYDLVMGDTVEAALIHDSAADTLAAVRSETVAARTMAYAIDDVEIEFELIGGRIVGHVDSPRPGTVYLDQPTLTGPAVDEILPDELGSFEFPLRLPATFRLRFEDDAGRSIATGWIDGPHRTIDDR